MIRRTKIVATVGPASESEEELAGLMRAGVNVFRLNLSHGDVEDHLARFRRIRKVSAGLGLWVGVLADLPGPKIRAARFPGPTALIVGSSVELRPGDTASSADEIEVDYEALLSDLAPGDQIIVGDGAVTMQVTGLSPLGATCLVLTGGTVQGQPGVHLPSERLTLRTPTSEDIELLRTMTSVGVDFAAISFVRSAADIVEARQVSGPNGPALVAKIETRAAIDDLDAIIEAADALMVARGDLGIECPLEEVPHLQKRIIRSCVEAGVPVITATQMLESMIESPSPTRAEVSDVANAVFDGTDAVMLSGETAIGAHPQTVVATMSRIVEEAEKRAQYRQWGSRLGRVQRAKDTAGELRVTQAVTHAAWQAADEVGVTAILCCTRTGRTARAMARYRPMATLLGVSPSAEVLRRMLLSWGVQPMIVDNQATTDELVWHAVEACVRNGFARADDHVCVLVGDPRQGTQGATDVMRIVRVG